MNRYIEKMIGRIFLFTSFCLFLMFACAQPKPEERFGWTLSVQTYTFRSFSLAEALEKADQAGLNTVEVYRSQRIHSEGEEQFIDAVNNDSLRVTLLNLFKENGVKPVAYGVIYGDTPEEWEQQFAFASSLGIETINVEPKEEFLSLIGELASRYKIKVGIHNHPKGTTYWHPDTVLSAIKKANSPYVGACADIGHWVRSGLDPVECLRKYEGHLVSLHMKDLKEKQPKTHDVPWGTGVCDIPAIVDELIRQQFRGNISIEYEHNWDDNLGEVAQSIDYFRKLLLERRKE